MGDANSLITQINDQAKMNGTGVTSSVQITTTEKTCSLVEITAYEGNVEPMIIGGVSVKLGTKASGYTDRIGSGVIYPGATKVYASPDPRLLYLSGLAGDFVTWSVLS